MRGTWKRAAAGAAGLVVLGSVFAGGVVTGRATESNKAPARGISESEHDRLLETCVVETDAAAECAAWISGVVRNADAQGVEYDELVEDIADEYDNR